MKALIHSAERDMNDVYNLALASVANNLDPIIVYRERVKPELEELETAELLSPKYPGGWAYDCWSTYEYWGRTNILVSPDLVKTVTSELVKQIHFLLTDCNKDVVLGIYKTDKPQDKLIVEGSIIIEKPKDRIDEANAVAVIGFNPLWGYRIFNGLSNNKRCPLPENAQYINLNNSEILK